MKILLTLPVHAKITAMMRAVETEVGAIASGYINATKDVVVTNIYITEQGVSGADVDFTEKGVDEATMQAIMAGEVVVGWVHSHGKMKPFWSGTDEKSIGKLLGHTGTWLVSIVGNHACDLVGRVDYYCTTPFGVEHMKVDNVQIDLEPILPPELIAEIDLAIKTNVKAKSFIYGCAYGNWVPKNGNAVWGAGGRLIGKQTGIEGEPGSDTKNGNNPSEISGSNEYASQIDKVLFEYYKAQGYSEEEAAGLIIAMAEDESETWVV
jgi:proteasome lid subunit RPN8/RPN11